MGTTLVRGLAVVQFVAGVVKAYGAASKRLHLSSFSYTKPAGGGATMWTVDDWITTSDIVATTSTAKPLPCISEL